MILELEIEKRNFSDKTENSRRNEFISTNRLSNISVHKTCIIDCEMTGSEVCCLPWHTKGNNCDFPVIFILRQISDNFCTVNVSRLINLLHGIIRDLHGQKRHGYINYWVACGKIKSIESWYSFLHLQNVNTSYLPLSTRQQKLVTPSYQFHVIKTYQQNINKQTR
jgi:hypothetical protein